jgi:hypothetical protein
MHASQCEVLLKPVLPAELQALSMRLVPGPPWRPREAD